MLIVPTWQMKNGHVPLPGVVSYSILHLFILKDGQTDLHPKAPSQTCWSMTAAKCSCHYYVCRASITSSIRTPTPWRGWASGRTSRNPGCSLLPILLTMSNWVSNSHHWSFSSVHLDAPSSRPLIQPSKLQVPGKGPHGSPQPLGASHAPGLHFLLHDSICNSAMAFLHCICSHFHLCCSPTPINWTCQAESNVPCTGIGEFLFYNNHPKNKIASPGARTTALVDSFFKTICKHVSN